MQKTLFLLFIILLLSSCNNKNSSTNTSVISGAGATFPYPFYNIAFRDYMRSHHEITVNYGAIGSGAGIKSLRDKSVDFGASDAFLSDKEMQTMNGTALHIATCMGAVVLVYTLAGVDSLRLSGDLIADIFMGEITRWNDTRIARENPDKHLPNLEITPVYRSDGSGTTFNFSDYLSHVSPRWKSVMGKGKALKWNAGIAAKGNPGIAGIVQQTEGAIGYIGSEYALTLKLKTAQLKNKGGNYVNATLETISAAANVDLPDDMRVSLINSADPQAYPISLLTWILVYENQLYDNRTENSARELKHLLYYMLSPKVQRVASQINYAPLSPSALQKTKILIDKIHYGGNSLSVREQLPAADTDSISLSDTIKQ